MENKKCQRGQSEAESWDPGPPQGRFFWAPEIQNASNRTTAVPRLKESTSKWWVPRLKLMPIPTVAVMDGR